MELKIEDLKPGMVEGVQVQMPCSTEVHKERYFNWEATTLTAKFKSTDVVGGILTSWHHTPVFNEIETHVDAEMFYFQKGTAIMLFIDVKDGKPDMDSAQMVRIKAGTQIIIAAGKGHFVPLAADSEPVQIVVVAPPMDAPRMELPEEIEGIKKASKHCCDKV